MIVGVHATNVNGLGASHVADSLMPPLLKLLGKLGHANIVFSGGWSKRLGQRLSSLNLLRRFVEIEFAQLFFQNCDVLLVLGDIPLRGIKNQYLFVQQAHLFRDSVNPYVSKSFKFQLMRKLFESNIRHVSGVFVQTDATRDALKASYGLSETLIEVVSHPPGEWTKPAWGKWERRSTPQPTTRLFYPASCYPHKNHEILASLGSFGADVEVTLTARADEIPIELRKSNNLRLIGPIGGAEVLQEYLRADALVFPSLLESYGLPLVEAMFLGMPILCSDLPHCRCLCDAEPFYFDPLSPASLVNAVRRFRTVQEEYQPNWRSPLLRIETSWHRVAETFASVMC